MKKIFCLTSFFLAIIALFGVILNFQQKCINKWKREAEKNMGMFVLMDQWVCMKQEKRAIEGYFAKNNYKRIAIYGMGYVGKRLLKELDGSEIEIAYGIDRNASSIYSTTRLLTMQEELPRVDIIVVTAIGAFDEVYDELVKKVECPIVAIEDIINEI